MKNFETRKLSKDIIAFSCILFVAVRCGQKLICKMRKFKIEELFTATKQTCNNRSFSQKLDFMYKKLSCKITLPHLCIINSSIICFPTLHYTIASIAQFTLLWVFKTFSKAYVRPVASA